MLTFVFLYFDICLLGFNYMHLVDQFWPFSLTVDVHQYTWYILALPTDCNITNAFYRPVLPYLKAWTAVIGYSFTLIKLHDIATERLSHTV